MGWEYKHVAASTTLGGQETLMLNVNALGSLGWEAVGICSVDATIGANAVMVLLKRQTRDLDPPAGGKADWYEDPSGRAVLRHWDGMRWTEHVSSNGVADKDYPVAP